MVLNHTDANRLRWEALTTLDYVMKAYDVSQSIDGKTGQRIPRDVYVRLGKAATRLKLPAPPKQPIT